MPFALVQLPHPLNNLAAEVRPWRIVPARLITTSTNTVARSHFLGQAHSSAKDTIQSQASLRRANPPRHRPFSMPTIRHGSTSSSAPRPGAGGGSKERPPPSAPRPSSSIILLSPTNQLLLLHRVRTSSSFASAHVFPGGNLSAFHEGPIPGPDSPARHRDGEAYRLGAIRETFEESGILLARRRATATTTSGEGGDQHQQQQQLLDLPEPVREAGRRAVHAGSARFVDWLAGAGGVADVGGLVPFTRWVTPANMAPRRFTTQMYLYMLPTECPEEEDCSAEVVGAPVAPGGAVVIPKPTHDGGVEHTAAAFDSVEGWLARARAGGIILFPPQMYLLTLLARFLTGPPGGAAAQDEGLRRRHYEEQRDALRAFLAREPGGGHPTGRIAWADKVMSPRLMFMRRADGRSVLGVDGPGPELKGSGRGGDWERVVLVRFGPEGPREVEVRSREEVLEEEREAERREVEQDKRAQGGVAGKL